MNVFFAYRAMRTVMNFFCLQGTVILWKREQHKTIGGKGLEPLD